ncbi:bifunctional [glutamine synthetase] adenylyltransferase/[glutamine synthetase]-adenylyl-L-tyrosine phosphorylase [Sphingomonas flavalba]|uniref:bifunctional [glutamine synthetase] adenylyltransferase/[glutamine synthetase]-adenylyl-L-tyrosine phosphorylase n=1 Tax=Sphingomonas flavalba TaxID=2559804 RepID=UPI0039E05E22
MIDTPTDGIAGALARAEGHSPFLRHAIGRRPDIAAWLADGALDAALALAWRGDADPDAPVARRLRRLREGVMMVLAIGDLAGAYTLEQVVEPLSDLADQALDEAIAAAIAERTPGAEARGFAVIALGKHGSRELNFSSDIDPILLFDPETLPTRPREEPEDAAVRIGRRVVELLQARDADGHVFRVDLRLRPAPEVTPIVLPVNAAISHYESSALPWERAAFIRARACAGDCALGSYFLDAIRPFVWRRTLDFGAIGQIRAMSSRIRDHHAQGQILGPGYDLKRGRGGIREVEFFAQIHQMIHGGREPELRAPATLSALAALADAGRIDPRDAAALAAAYRVLRTVEHRLQMVDDRQTHSLPVQAEALDNVAALHGLADGAALVARLAPHVERVGHVYDALDDGSAPRLPRDPALLAAALAKAGFVTDAAATRITRWRDGTIRALRSEPARAALEGVLPALVAAFGAAPDPDAAINRFDALVGGLPSAINFFRLMEARPGLTRMVADILSHAPALAEQIGRRPELLDGLIDATALAAPGDVPTLVGAFAAGEEGEDYQALLDGVRRRVNEKRFALGVQLIEGGRDPLAVAAGYSRVAEAALTVLADAAVAAFEEAHGRVPGSELVILALGRFGGEALTHASDLDLVYLFTGDFTASSDGRRPLDATLYYNRLAQRVSAALSVPTAAGPLYEVDTRLRPSGNQGLLAVSFDSFAQYQRENAWTWEHMALARARPVYGSAAARAALADIVTDVLHRPRAAGEARRAAAEMRAEITRHKPPAGLLDAKLIPGGLVDLEFCVHVAQLENRAGFDPHLPGAIAALAAAGHLPAALGEANEMLTRLLVVLRLIGQEPAPATQALAARACGFTDWAALLAAYAEARQTVSALWRPIAAGIEEETKP